MGILMRFHASQDLIVFLLAVESACGQFGILIRYKNRSNLQTHTHYTLGFNKVFEMFTKQLTKDVTCQLGTYYQAFFGVNVNS